MPKCFVRGCPNKTRAMKFNSQYSLHGFPKSLERIKLWLINTGQDFNDIDAYAQSILEKNNNYRICSMHFPPDSCYTLGLRRYLKSDAVPTIFPQANRGIQAIKKVEDLPTTSRTARKAISEVDKSLHTFQPSYSQTKPVKILLPAPPRKVFKGYVQAPTSHDASTNKPFLVPEEKGQGTNNVFGMRSVKTQTDFYVGKKCARTSTRDMFRKKDASMWTGPSEDIADSTATQVASRTSTNDVQVELSHEHPHNVETKSFPLQLDYLHNRPYSTLSRPIPLSLPKKCRRVVHEEDSYNVSDVQSGMKFTKQGDNIFINDLNCSYQTAENINEPSILIEPEEDVVKERKFVVFESCLDELLSKLTCSYNDECHASIIKRDKKVNGTLLTVYGTCHNGHTMKLWQSQPTVRQVPVGDVLSSAALLFSGCNFIDVKQMFNFLGVPFISENTYSIYQKKIIFPTIDRHWKRDRQSTIQSLQGKPLALVGDGQSSSKGFNTKYSMYTLLDDKTKKIVDFHTIQATASASIGSMELKAFRRCVNNVLNEGLQVHIISTERNVGIKRIMRDEYNHIAHQFDLRHYCENFRKKLIARSKKKSCKAITPWIPEIVNHLWASSCTSNGNIHLMEETWNSILYHVTNQHLWDDGILVTACVHPPLTTDEEKKRPWIPDKTPAFNELQELVSSKQIQKDIQYLAESCHTEDIDVFHNLLLKYLPKHTHFKKDAIKARTKLAVLAHNASVTQPQVKIPHTGTYTGPLLRFDHVPLMMADVIRLAT
ncbi:uncharacterized protein O3C94_021392 [Discoglossus pictus]